MQNESEGINKLRKGALILIFTAIFIFIGLIVFLILVISFLPTFLTTTSFPTTLVTFVSLLFGIFVAFVILTTIGVTAGIIGLLNIRNGFGILRNLGRDVRTGYIGTTLYLLSLAMIVLGALLGIAFPIGSAVIVLGNIIEIIGNVLIGVGFYKVGGIYNEGTTKIGGILVAIPIIWGMILVAIPVLIVSFIGYILVYIGLGKIKPRAMVVLPAQPNYPPQIYQVGQGIIRGNGYAQVSLYSSSQATILSARIEGTALTSVNVNPVVVNPVVLQPGYNEVTIQFNSVSSLTPGLNYLITLVVNIGGNVSEVKASAVYQP